MAASEVKNVRAPTAMAPDEIGSPASTASPSTSSPAPAIAGMPRRKEKRAASGRVKPSERAAVMVTPERLVPGISASAWAAPTAIAGHSVMSAGHLAMRAQAVGSQHEQGKHDGVPGDDVGTADGVDEARRLEDEPEDHRRDGGRGDIEHHARWVCQPAAHRSSPPPIRCQHVAPEIGDDGGERADMRHDVDEQALVLPAGQHRHQDEMARRGDRQELGDALHQGKHDDLFRRHCSSVMDGLRRAVRGRIAWPNRLSLSAGRFYTGGAACRNSAAKPGGPLPMAKLLHFPVDPFCRRIRISLGEYRCEAEVIEERPWENRASFVALSPAGILPVFIDDDGTAAIGIEAASEYLDETRGSDSKTLIGTMPAERAETRRLVAWFDGKFHAEVSGPVLTEKVIRRFLPRESGGGAPTWRGCGAAWRWCASIWTTSANWPRRATGWRASA
jgi:hypothetical protein